MSAEADTSLPQSPADLQPAERNPAPVWLIILLALLVYGGLVQLDQHGGGFNERVYGPFASIDAVTSAWPADPTLVIRRSGRQVFDQNCAACHQSTGLGSSATGCPPLAGSDWVNAEGPNRIVRALLNGLSGPINVSGASYGTDGKQMPPWGALSDDQLAAVLTYIRGEWKNKASLVTPEQVKAIREKTKSQSGPWAPAALLQIPVKD